ncbi:hypothetical protein GCM10029964_103300 [Kibdelosporangium lantanae]
MVLRRSTRLLITISAVAALLVAGGIAAASLFTRHATSQAEPEVYEAAPKLQPDVHQVANPEAMLTFDVSADWEPADDDETLTTSTGITLSHIVDWGPYTCQGAEYGRAFAGSGVTPATDRKAAKVAADLAASVAADQYSDGDRTAAVRITKRQPLARDGVEGALVEAEATVPSSADPCAGTKGTVTVVALPTSAGMSVFVTGVDVTPGPEEPTPLLPADHVAVILASLRVTH